MSAVRVAPGLAACAFAAMVVGIAMARLPAIPVAVVVMLAVALVAVATAFADLERFVLVALFPAMIFPATLLSPGGAQVAAADLLLLVALAVWLAYRSAGYGRGAFVSGNPVFAPAVAFVGVAAASIVWTSSAGATVKMTVQLLEIAVLVPLLFASVPASLRRISHGLYAFLAATSVLALVEVVAFLPRAARGDYSGQYLPGLHKNSSGSFLGVGFVLAFVLATQVRDHRLRRLLNAVTLLELAGLAATYSRGALVGAGAGVLVCSLLLRRRRAPAILLVVVASAVALVLVQPKIDSRAALAGGYDSSVVRVLSYRDGIHAIKQHPLLGTGAGTYWDAIPELRIGLADPNNLFLLTWAELGLAGMATLLALLVRFARTLGRARRLPDPARVLAVAAGGGAVSLLVHFQFDATWTRGTATICFALIGLMLAAMRLAPAPASARVDALPVSSPSDQPVPRAGPASRFRVVHVITSERYAGIERHVLRLARGLRGAGVRCEIACPPGARELRRAAADAGVDVLPASDASAPRWLPALVARLASEPPDVVHVHDGQAAVAAWPLAARRNVRLVRTQHFIEPASTKRSGWRRAASLAVHHAFAGVLDALVAVSEPVAAAARERDEARAPELAVIAPGIDLPADGDVERAREVRVGTRHPVVAYLGRLEEDKGISLLLCAASLVLQRRPDTRFVIAGEGSRRDELRELAHGLGLDDAVDWLGEVAQPGDVLAGAHILAHPTTVESFGLAVAEAMAWELPVVGVAAGAMPDVVQHGLTGTLVPDADPAEFAHAILDLIADPRRARRLGVAGRARALEFFGTERTVDLTMALYERVRSVR